MYKACQVEESNLWSRKTCLKKVQETCRRDSFNNLPMQEKKTDSADWLQQTRFSLKSCFSVPRISKMWFLPGEKSGGKQFLGFNGSILCNYEKIQTATIPGWLLGTWTWGLWSEFWQPYYLSCLNPVSAAPCLLFLLWFPHLITSGTVCSDSIFSLGNKICWFF